MTKRLRFILWQKILATIYNMLLEKEDIYITEVAHKLNMNYQQIRPYINLLEQTKLITRTKKNRKTYIDLTEKGKVVAYDMQKIIGVDL